MDAVIYLGSTYGAGYLEQCCLSGFLAKCWGVFCLLGALAFFRKKSFEQLMEAHTSRNIVLVTGFISFVIGVLHVVAHDLWVWDWRVIITLFGWSALLKGFFRMADPGWSTQWGTMISLFWYRWMLLAMFILGAFLLYKGYSCASCA